MTGSIVADDIAKARLKAVPYFSLLADEALVDVVAEVLVRRYQAHQIIMLEGEPDAGLQLVTEGICKVYRVSEQGREHILATLGPGDSCNEVPVVDGGPNPANLAAVTDATLWVLQADGLNRLRQRHPALNEMIIRNLAMRCRQLVQRVYSLSFLSVTGRLASFLLQQYDEDNPSVQRQWTQDEIAAQLGTVREMVGRAFREMQQAELITIDRHRIEILDREGLKALT